MSCENRAQRVDLTAAENVQRGQAVYDRLTSGERLDVAAELDAAYGVTSESND